MTFLIDVQLPPRMKPWFAGQGEKALHAGELEDGLCLPDSTLWEAAKKNGWVIVTKDIDFSDMSILHGSPPQVLLIRYGNCGTRELLEEMGKTWKQVKDALSKRGVRLIALHRSRIEIYQNDNEDCSNSASS